jgi:hypothetical protein
MDFIFEDDVDEVGSDIEAYCPKCKGDTSHTVITKYEDEIRRVQCSPCGDVHGFRKPRGEAEEDIPEPVAAKKRATTKKPTWDEARAKLGEKKVSNPRPYSIRDTYTENDIVNHPKFGVGFVTEISENKAEITFQDERRVLIHNRPDLAAQMPAIAPLPAPREDKRGKGKGKAGKKGAEPPAAKSKEPVKAAPPAKPGKQPIAASGKKAERARAAATKKSAAKVKSAAKPAKRPAPPARKKAARPVRRAVKAAKAKTKAKAKAKKGR